MFSAISLPRVPAPRQGAPLNQIDLDLISDSVAWSLAWRVLFPVGAADRDDALNGLIAIGHVASGAMFLSEGRKREVIRETIGKTLAKFAGLNEREAYELERKAIKRDGKQDRENKILRSIGNAICCDVKDEVRKQYTTKGKAERRTKLFSQFPKPDNPEADAFDNPTLAVAMAGGTTPQSILGGKNYNHLPTLIHDLKNKCLQCRAELITEINNANGDMSGNETVKIVVRILASESVWTAKTDRDRDAAITLAVAKVLEELRGHCSERTARTHKKKVWARIDRACESGSYLWVQIREGLRLEVGSNEIVDHYALNRGRKRVSVKTTIDDTQLHGEAA